MEKKGKGRHVLWSCPLPPERPKSESIDLMSGTILCTSKILLGKGACVQMTKDGGYEPSEGVMHACASKEKHQEEDDGDSTKTYKAHLRIHFFHYSVPTLKQIKKKVVGTYEVEDD